jgi:hypothetical protein
MKTSKKTTKTTVKSKSAAKAVTVSKSAKPATAAQQTRSMAAYKAHITRQNQIIEASKSAAVKKDARVAIATITANMKSA